MPLFCTCLRVFCACLGSGCPGAGSGAHRADFMGHGIALDDEPGAAAAAVVPIFAHHAGDIVAKIDIVVESTLFAFRALPRFHGHDNRALRLGVAQIGEFAVLAFAAKWTCNAHFRLPRFQCRLGWAPWPFSSIIAPRSKRSRRNSLASSCGVSVASRCAKTRPEAGVALKPP